MTFFLLLVHERLYVTVLLFMIVMGGWGLVDFFRKQPISDHYTGALIIGEVLILIEALLGVILYMKGFRPVRSNIHILYGITAVIALPGAFAYTRGRDSRWEALIYACVCLFLAGLSIRLQQVATLQF
jgi:hypothetical protein